MFTTQSSSTEFAEPDNSAEPLKIDARNFWRPGQLRKILEHRYTETCLSCVIFANFVICILEADAGVDAAKPPSWMTAMNYIFSAVYTFETALRMYSFGCRFWRNPWSIVDFLIVLVDDTIILIGVLMDGESPSVSMMRLVRLLRLSRSKGLLKAFPDFHMQIECLLGSLRPLCVGLMLITFTLLVFSITGVLFIHPINHSVAATGMYASCDRCPRAFESVANAMLTLAQLLLLGENWGALSIPIMEHEPFTAIYFILGYVSICLILINVVLGAVVDSAQQARSSNDRFRAWEKGVERRNAQKKLSNICRELDGDQSGEVSKEELYNGMRDNPEFRTYMHAMDIGIEEIDIVWDVLDADKSGCVDCNEFVEQLYKMKSNEIHAMVLFIRYYVAEIRLKIQNDLRNDNAQIASKFDHLIESLRKEIKMLGSTHLHPDSPPETQDIDTNAGERASSDTDSLIRNVDLGHHREDNPSLPTQRIADVSLRPINAKRVPNLLNATPAADIQALLDIHWKQQEALLVELAASLSAATPPRTHEKDRQFQQRAAELALVFQPLSAKMVVGACSPTEQSELANSPLPELELCSGPPEPASPTWYWSED